MFNVWNDKITQSIVILLYRCTIRNARFIFFQKKTGTYAYFIVYYL